MRTKMNQVHFSQDWAQPVPVQIALATAILFVKALFSIRANQKRELAVYWKL